MWQLCKRALLIAFVVAAHTAAAEESLTPKIVLIERNPWLMVIGSDSPSFALYSNGLLVFKKKRGRTASLVSTQLTDREIHQLLDLLEPEGVRNAKDNYALSQATDQVDNELHLWVDGKRKDIWIYGPLRLERPTLEDFAGRESSFQDSLKYYEEMMALRSEVPKELLALLDTILNFNFTKPAEAWLPSKVEVFIWPYEYSPETPLPWPENWPQIADAEHGEDDYHKFSLPIAEYETLRALMRARGQKQAVLIEGRKWAISYRLPFPEEESWEE